MLPGSEAEPKPFNTENSEIVGCAGLDNVWTFSQIFMIN